MISLLQINKAIVDTIKKALVDSEYDPEGLIIAEDVSEPIIRPSLKIAIEDSNNGKFNSQCREKTITVRVYFFAPDRYEYKIANAEMQDLLENTFLNDLKVTEGFYIPIESVESEVSDTVLICSFDLYAIELLPDTDTSEPMEELEYKEEIK